MSQEIARDDEQRRRAATTLDVPICVEAAAGTGKTKLMEDRVAEVVRRGKASIDQVVAITFTEFAAAELRARIRSRLSAEATTSENDDSAQTRFRSALGALDNARIETIHAFAASLLRERPVEAGIDPRFEVLDELGMQIDLDLAWDEWFARQLEDDPGPVERMLLLGFSVEQVKQLGEVLNRNRDLRPFQHSVASEFDLQKYVESLDTAVGELHGLLADCRDPADRGYGQALDIADYQARLAAAIPEEAVLIIASDFDIKKRGDRRNWRSQGSFDRQQEICEALGEDQRSARELVRSQALGDLLKWLEAFPDWYDERRRQAGKLDFDDLLVRARTLLRDDVAVRRHFQDRYKFILVDEFQDTDPLQIEIVFFLCEGHPGGARHWQDVRLDAGKLFVVGDPKQSIYRFRRADIAMYDQARSAVARDGEVIDVFQNFRCADEIVSWVNQVFAGHMDGRNSVQARYIPLVSWPSRQPELQGDKLAVLVPASPVENTRADDLRRAEARSIASLIESRIVGQWEIEDPDRPGEVRLARPGDIVVLVPTRTKIDLFEQVFQERGLVYRHEGGAMFYRRQEVRDLVAYLSALDNPSDELSVVATLRHVYGLADEDLLLFKSGGGTFDFRKAAPEGSASIADAFAEMVELHRTRNDRTLPAFVDQVVERSRLTELHELLPQGRQAVANIGKVSQLARQYQGQPAATLHKFVRWLRTNREESARESDSALAATSGDEVRILTVHMAKGLEFPIVILANLGTAFSRKDQEFVDRESRQIHIQRNVDGPFTTPDFARASQQEQERQGAERPRCLYVACTRARDHLVVSAFGKAENCWLSLLAPFLPGLPRIDSREFAGIDSPIGFVSPDPVDVDDLLAAREAWERQRADLLAAPVHRRIVTATGQKQLATSEEPVVRSPLSLASRKGIVLHRVLATIDLSESDEERVKVLTSSLASEAGLAEASPEIAEMVLGVLGSQPVLRAANSRNYWREVAFGVPIEGLLLEGSIDLLFEEGDGLVIVDYKSDDVTVEAALERVAQYRDQAALYAFACHEIAGRAVKEFVFHFARPGTSVTIDGPGLVADGRLLMESLARGEQVPLEIPAA